ncbi:MAG: DUF167 family protein [Mesorhizobium sp.]|jgi:uncharacterized protein (TIGR00251 family)
MSQPFRLRDDGIDLHVRLTPKSAVDRIDGIEQTSDGRSHAKARVRAIPEKGEANDALERLIARAFGVPASAVAIIAGQTARLKTVRITGDPAKLADCVAQLRQR